MIIPMIIYIIFKFTNLNKMVIKRLNKTPNISNTNWFIDSIVTLDLEEILLCSSEFIIFQKTIF